MKSIKNKLLATFIVIAFLFLALVEIQAQPLGKPLDNGKKKIAVIGDSITADGGYIEYLQTRCPFYTFHNFGVSGESTQKILKRIRYRNSDLNRKIVGIWDYDDIIVLAGINNIASPLTVIEDLKTIYQMAKNNPYKNTRVIAVSLTPWKGYETWDWKKQQNTEMVNAFILSKPQGVDVTVNVYSALEDPANPKALKADYRRPHDKLHPRDAGQAIIGNAIYHAAFHRKHRETFH
jgi:lysophospholipase L1-like esterase